MVIATLVSVLKTVPIFLPSKVATKSLLRSLPSIVARTSAELPAGAVLGLTDTISGTDDPGTWTDVTDKLALAESVIVLPARSTMSTVVKLNALVPFLTGVKVMLPTFLDEPGFATVKWNARIVNVAA